MSSGSFHLPMEFTEIETSDLILRAIVFIPGQTVLKFIVGDFSYVTVIWGTKYIDKVIQNIISWKNC